MNYGVNNGLEKKFVDISINLTLPSIRWRATLLEKVQNANLPITGITTINDEASRAIKIRTTLDPNEIAKWATAAIPNTETYLAEQVPGHAELLVYLGK